LFFSSSHPGFLTSLPFDNLRTFFSFQNFCNLIPIYF
jgi:hypothetical protein